MKNTSRVLFLSIILVLSTCGILPSSKQPKGTEHLAAAEHYSSEGKPKEAIEEYEAHMRWRLAKKKRPEWENPYFYELLIGDLYLRDNNAPAAKASYLKALKEQVDSRLVVDRLRALASWYSERKQFDTAIALLSEFEYLDPILMNLSLDRIARDSLRVEQSEAAASQ